MKKFLKKSVASFIILVVSIMCMANSFPIYATTNNTDVMYEMMNNSGEVYKATINSEEKEIDQTNLPIETQIKYYLNGEEILIEDLKGKSGKVKIEINYTNKDVHFEKINGEDVVMYTPYVVATGFIVDSEKFQNTIVSSGKIIDNGTDTIVVGVAFPGMQESLDLDEEDFEIPGKIEIESDVQKFELGNIYMYIGSNIFEEDSFDFLDDFDDMFDDVGKLKDSSKKLVDGSATLRDGAQTLSSKYSEFNSGLSQYTKGVSTINANYVKINDGIITVNDNTKKLVAGSASLNNGISTLKTTLTAMVSGIVQIKQGTDGIYNGLTQAVTKVDDFKTQVASTDLSGLATIIAQTDATIQNLESTKKTLQNIVNGLPETVDTTQSTSITSPAPQSNPVTTTTTQESNTLENTNIVTSTENKLTESQILAENEVENVTTNSDIVENQQNESNVVTEEPSEVTQQIPEQQVSEPESTENVIAVPAETVNLQSEPEIVVTNVTTSESVPNADKQKLLKQIQNLDSQIETLKQTLSIERAAYNTAITTAQTQVCAGLTELQDSLKVLQAVSLQVKNGIDKMTVGSPELQKGLETLQNGSNALNEGVSKLSEGTNTLQAGSNTLKNGISTLDSNSATLVSGSNAVQEGTNSLSDGAAKLADGMSKFDSEGINKIYDLINGDLDSANKRIKKLIDLSNNASKEDGQYKYIIKVDRIDN